MTSRSSTPTASDTSDIVAPGPLQLYFLAFIGRPPNLESDDSSLLLALSLSGQHCFAHLATWGSLLDSGMKCMFDGALGGRCFIGCSGHVWSRSVLPNSVFSVSLGHLKRTLLGRLTLGARSAIFLYLTACGCFSGLAAGALERCCLLEAFHLRFSAFRLPYSSTPSMRASSLLIPLAWFCGFHCGSVGWIFVQASGRALLYLNWDSDSQLSDAGI